MRISDWSSDVCSSDLIALLAEIAASCLAGTVGLLSLAGLPALGNHCGLRRITLCGIAAFLIKILIFRTAQLRCRLANRLGRGPIGSASCRERVCQSV